MSFGGRLRTNATTAGEFEEELTRLRAAANEKQGVVHFMDRNSSHFRDEVRVLREKLLGVAGPSVPAAVRGDSIVPQ